MAARKRAKTGRGRKAAGRSRKGTRGRDRIKATERAIRELGEDRLRAGSVRVSRSRWVTPTGRGLGSGSVAKTLSRIASVPGDPFFSYTIRTRFRGRDGKRKTVEVSGLGVPRLQDAKRFRKRLPSGRLESVQQALRRLVRDQVRREVLGAVRKEWGAYTLQGDQATRMGRDRARRQLRRIKERQRASFQIDFERIVTPKRRASAAKRARKVRGTSRVRKSGARRTTKRKAPARAKPRASRKPAKRKR